MQVRVQVKIVGPSDDVAAALNTEKPGQDLSRPGSPKSTEGVSRSNESIVRLLGLPGGYSRRDMLSTKIFTPLTRVTGAQCGKVFTNSRSRSFAPCRIGSPSPGRRGSKSKSRRDLTGCRRPTGASTSLSGKSWQRPGVSPTIASPTMGIFRSGQCNTTPPGDLPAAAITVSG